jgi:hypothetical protein
LMCATCVIVAVINVTVKEFAMAGADVREKFDQAVQKSRNKELRELFQYGLGCHHAGMLRSDRYVCILCMNINITPCVQAYLVIRMQQSHSLRVSLLVIVQSVLQSIPFLQQALPHYRVSQYIKVIVLNKL